MIHRAWTPWTERSRSNWDFHRALAAVPTWAQWASDCGAVLQPPMNEETTEVVVVVVVAAAGGGLVVVVVVVETPRQHFAVLRVPGVDCPNWPCALGVLCVLR